MPKTDVKFCLQINTSPLIMIMLLPKKMKKMNFSDCYESEKDILQPAFRVHPKKYFFNSLAILEYGT